MKRSSRMGRPARPTKPGEVPRVNSDADPDDKFTYREGDLEIVYDPRKDPPSKRYGGGGAAASAGIGRPKRGA